MTEKRPAIVCLIVSERRGCMHSQMHTDRAGFSVFSCARKLLSHSVSVTDERALKGIGLKWFTITWALRLWSRTAACAVLQRYYIIYNDIIDHYVFWHSTLSQLCFINQMMKGERNRKSKANKKKHKHGVSRHRDSFLCNITNNVTFIGFAFDLLTRISITGMLG